MDDSELQSELDQVTAELTAARIQHASLGARIAGLEARQLALTRALGNLQPADSNRAQTPRYRTDAIVAVLEASGTEMSIQDVITGLAGIGRPGETYDNVGVDLAYLAERGRVTRVRRGVYASAPASTTARSTSSGSAERRARNRPLLRRHQEGNR
ncbi:MAG TPA: hypothetical protein VFQ68_45005 [Streptosporangiaceae bacterium]|nr:hypothetical protein [Streptosporangiaceae bacterium]